MHVFAQVLHHVACLFVLMSGTRQRSESVTAPTKSAAVVVPVLTVGQPPVVLRNLKILHRQRVAVVSRICSLGVSDSSACRLIWFPSCNPLNSFPTSSSSSSPPTSPPGEEDHHHKSSKKARINEHRRKQRRRSKHKKEHRTKSKKKRGNIDPSLRFFGYFIQK